MSFPGELPLHPKTINQINKVVKTPPHALLIVGPTGSGKQTVARILGAKFLDIVANKLENSPAWMATGSKPDSPYGVDDVKAVRHFITLRSSAESINHVNKIVLINQADKLSLDGQNSLLKILEEPPKGSFIMLTASGQQALLPTVSSRCQTLVMHKPERDITSRALGEYFSEKDVSRSMNIADDWPETALAILDNSVDHPLAKAAFHARELLTKPTFERLAMVDKLSKQREEAIDLCVILQRMAHTALAKHAGSVGANKWSKVEVASFECETALNQSANAKLCLTELMLNM